MLDNEPGRYPGFERLLRRKRREYENQSWRFADMAEDPFIAEWLAEFTLWDEENEEIIQLNDLQLHDVNRMHLLRNILYSGLWIKYNRGTREAKKVKA